MRNCYKIIYTFFALIAGFSGKNIAAIQCPLQFTKFDILQCPNCAVLEGNHSAHLIKINIDGTFFIIDELSFKSDDPTYSLETLGDAINRDNILTIPFIKEDKTRCYYKKDWYNVNVQHVTLMLALQKGNS